MTNSRPTRTVAILYGVFEGPGTSQGLRHALEQAGFTITPDPATADIIFAHSGGCYLIPPKNQAKLVVLVGVAYWPGRLWIFATMRKLWRETFIYLGQGQWSHWWRKGLYYVRYTSNLRTYLRMWQLQGTQNDWNSKQPQIIIRNRHDVYCQPDITGLPFRGPRTFVSFPGEHDDCWDNPKRYVDLLQSVV